jgi:hypothetical protein
MEFTLPTSKAEMYSVLKDIFYFYRYQPILYTGVELKELELPRMEYLVPTDEQLTERATKLLSATQQREIASTKKAYQTQIEELVLRLNAVDVETDTLVNAVEDKYKKSVGELERQAVKNGVAFSDIVHSRIADLQSEKTAEISGILADATDKKSQIQAKITALEELRDGVKSYYQPIHDLEISIKIDELKAQAEKDEREVFKYNNELYRKEQEYANALIRQKANLELKFLEIRSGEFSKEELIEMGYYEDVLKCISAYYDTLEPLTAYQDIVEEKKLMLYLEDYYDDVVYIYKVKALEE